jgi:hypothetical protein
MADSRIEVLVHTEVRELLGQRGCWRALSSKTP